MTRCLLRRAGGGDDLINNRDTLEALHHAGAEKKSEIEHAADDRSCRQCDGPLDGSEQRYQVGEQSVWLHAACARFFTE